MNKLKYLIYCSENLLGAKIHREDILPLMREPNPFRDTALK